MPEEPSTVTTLGAGMPVPFDEGSSNAPAENGGTGRRKLGFGFWASSAWIALILFGAVFAPVLGLDNPNKSDPCASLATTMINENATGAQASLIATGTAPDAATAQQMLDAGNKPEFPPDCTNPTADSRTAAYPSAHHWLGTDSLGQDNFARIVYGGRVALTVGIGSIGFAMVFGGTIGLLAGYYRGRIEALLMTVVDIMLAFPALVLAIAIVAVRGQSLFNVCFAVAVVGVPAFARIARAATLTFAEREFVTAARVMGAKNSRIIIREILPNAILPVMAFALVAIAIAIVAEGGLAFLGLSVRPPTASWGSMISDAYKNSIDDRPLITIIPALTMFITVLAFNLLGDKFRTIFDVKESAL